MATPPAPSDGLLKRSLFRYGLKKDPEDVIAQAKDPSKSLKKTLGALDLTLLGVAAIIGAGIFVYAGLGAQIAGPHIIWSFVLVGFICALAGLAYSELAAAIPTSGSAYAYTYSALGEAMAWVLGWALVLEYAVGAAAVAIGWSANFSAFTRSALNMPLPTSLTSSPVDGGIINLPAVLLVVGIAALLIMGSKVAARMAGVFVVAKVSIILIVLGVGSYLLFTDIGFSNLSLSPPPSPPTAWYSALGAIGPILAAGAIIFFAYIGFDSVSTTAEETKNPKRDLPIGILGSLAICTALYIAASTVLMGMIPYTDLIAGGGVTAAQAAERLGEPFGYAFEANGVTWAANLIRIGAVIGIASVEMALLIGGPRVFFALARDGLLPQSWAKVHEKYGTPARTTIGVAVGVALVAGFGTLKFAGEVTNIGTLFAFVCVCIGVIILRYTKPDLQRPFKVPLNIGRFPVLALLGAIACFGLMISLHASTIMLFFAWMGIGLMIYALYGIRNSHLYGHVGRKDAKAPLPESEAHVVLEEMPRSG